MTNNLFHRGAKVILFFFILFVSYKVYEYNMGFYINFLLQGLLVLTFIIISAIFRQYVFIDRQIKVRFAPSPTGEMHVGNIRTALFNHLYAKQHNGKFFLRIEDTDMARSKAEYEQSIKDHLRWLDIDYEPLVLRQSERLDIYLKIADQLHKKGYAYYCQCVNLEQEVKSCPCENSQFSSGVLRFKVIRNKVMCFEDEILGKIKVNTNTIENFALLRSNGSPTYNFVVVVDDLALKITHVFRGNEHLYNTFKQLLIYEALHRKPPKFGHFPMINGVDGKKLSKRSGDRSIKAYRDMGVVPEALFNFLIRLGWGYGNQEIFTRSDAIKVFNINKISRSPAMFDMNKLMYLCGYYLHQNWQKHLAELLMFMKSRIGRSVTNEEIIKLRTLIPEFSKRSKLLVELADNLVFLFKPVMVSPENKVLIDKEISKEIIDILSAVPLNSWTESYLTAYIKEQMKDKMKTICSNLRLILLNTNYSPSIFLILEVLGKEETLRRLSI